MGTDTEEASPLSSSGSQQDEDDEDVYLSDQEDDDLEESILQVLEDGHLEDCHWSFSSVITQKSLLAAQREDLRKVMELLGLGEHHARTLLIHYRWDLERIFELLDQQGRDRLFSEADVPLQPTNKAGLPSSRPLGLVHSQLSPAASDGDGDGSRGSRSTKSRRRRQRRRSVNQSTLRHS